MNNEQPPPQPVLAIAVEANRDRHQVLVELGTQTLALAPEAAHALATALRHAATELCPIAAEGPQASVVNVERAPVPVDAAAALLIDTIDVLIGRYRKGKLMLPPAPSSKPASALTTPPGVIGLRGSVSYPQE